MRDGKRCVFCKNSFDYATFGMCSDRRSDCERYNPRIIRMFWTRFKQQLARPVEDLYEED